MGLFKSKTERELERRRLVKKTLNDMNRHVKELNRAKNLYIEKAKLAKQKGLMSSYNLAVSGLKITLAQERRAHEMLLNFEITSQMKDMSQMTSEFMKGLSVLSREMAALTKAKEFDRIQREFEMAIEGADMQTERLDSFMKMNQDTFQNQTVLEDTVSDDEIQSLIDSQLIDDSISIDVIDSELNEIQKKLSGSSERIK